MKGRFRKGKKAFHGTLTSPRQSKFENRYYRWRQRIYRNQRISLAVAQAAISGVVGAMQIASIQSSPMPLDITPGEWIAAKAKAIVEQSVITAGIMVKAFQKLD